MNEAEWLTCSTPGPMLDYLSSKLTARKVRLFGCGYLRQVWHRLEQAEGSRLAVAVAERFADGKTIEPALEKARQTAFAVAEAERAGRLLCWEDPVWQAVDAAHRDPRCFLGRVREETSFDPDPTTLSGDFLSRRAARYALYVPLLRCITGNPFRPTVLDPFWLAWSDGIISKLAQAIYDERAFDRMPILADALEDAGCTNADILNHCRQPGEHARGCWVVDLLLGME